MLGNSRAVVEDLIAENVPESKIRLIYNGSTFHSRRRTRDGKGEHWGAPDATVGVLVANLIHYKGHLDLIEV